MPAVKTGMTNVASHICSHIGTLSQAVSAAMSQVHWWHVRTRIKSMYHARGGCRTSRAVVRPCSSYQNSWRRLTSGTYGVQVWHADISVKLFRQISLFIHYLYTYLFSKLMIHIYIHFLTNRFSWFRTYSHLLFKKESSVKRSLLLFHFLFIVRGFICPICIFVG